MVSDECSLLTDGVGRRCGEWWVLYVALPEVHLAGLGV